MKRSLVLLLTVTLLASQAWAGLTFMETPYTWLDQYAMLIWKPLIQLVLINWAKSIVCGSYGTYITDLLSLSTSMTADEQTSYCETGIDDYVDSLFYGGGIENAPNSFGWKWNPFTGVAS